MLIDIAREMKTAASNGTVTLTQQWQERRRTMKLKMVTIQKREDDAKGVGQCC